MMQQASSSNRAFPYAITVKPKGGEQAYRPTSEQHRYERNAVRLDQSAPRFACVSNFARLSEERCSDPLTGFHAGTSHDLQGHLK